MIAPFLEHDGLVLYEGDAASVLRELPEASVDLCVTSPPFFALRDYGTARWEGGDPGCDHLGHPVGGPRTPSADFRSTGDEQRRRQQYRALCGKCGATRIDEQIGLEATPEEFVGRLVDVFREVRRVLRPTGVLMLEVGDTYSAGARGNYAGDSVRTQTKQTKGGTPTAYPARPVVALPGKNLMGLPWRLAFALQDDGWILRGDYIWARPNPMPASVRDRCTTAHSYVFHLTKRRDYFWDRHAIAEDAVADEQPPGGRMRKERTVRNGIDTRGGAQGNGEMEWESATRNARSVWTITTEPKGMGICPACLAYFPRNAPADHCGVEVVAHYAAFPAALAAKAILAATSEAGVCPGCGVPWERVVEKGEPELAANTWSANGAADQDVAAGPASTLKHVRSSRTLGFAPACPCRLDPVPAVVLDPFSGSGTTLLEARRLGRRGVGVELNRLYCEMAARRLEEPRAAERAAERSVEPVQLVIG